MVEGWSWNRTFFTALLLLPRKASLQESLWMANRDVLSILGRSTTSWATCELDSLAEIIDKTLLSILIVFWFVLWLPWYGLIQAPSTLSPAWIGFSKLSFRPVPEISRLSVRSVLGYTSLLSREDCTSELSHCNSFNTSSATEPFFNVLKLKFSQLPLLRGLPILLGLPILHGLPILRGLPVLNSLLLVDHDLSLLSCLLSISVSDKLHLLLNTTLKESLFVLSSLVDLDSWLVNSLFSLLIEFSLLDVHDCAVSVLVGALSDLSKSSIEGRSLLPVTSKTSVSCP